jgi:hypothetical protein
MLNLNCSGGGGGWGVVPAYSTYKLGYYRTIFMKVGNLRDRVKVGFYLLSTVPLFSKRKLIKTYVWYPVS